MSDPHDEFSFLAEQASQVGISGPIPTARRLNLTLHDGRVISGIRYGDQPPQITLLHGAGLNAHTWDTTILAMEVPALAIDLPGHGDSSWREDANYQPRVLAPDIASALDVWTDGPQILLGHSLGGMVAAAVAAHRRDLVAELILLDITPGISREGGPKQLAAFFAGTTSWASRAELVDRAVSFGLGGTRAAAERGVFHNSRIRADGRVEWKHHFAHLAAAAWGNGTGDDTALSAALNQGGWEDLATVATGTSTSTGITLIRASRGYVTEEDATVFSERLPGASIEVMETGHNIQEDDPITLGKYLSRIAQLGKG